MRSAVIRLLRPLAAFPVENGVGGPGVPDVCCVGAWIELKIGRRPSYASAPLEVTVRPSQRVWMSKWRRHGGRVWTLTKILGWGSGAETWYLHDGAWASEHLGKAKEDEVERASAFTHQHSEPTSRALVAAILQEQK